MSEPGAGEGPRRWTLQTVLERDRLFVGAGLVGVSGLAWIYSVSGVGPMSGEMHVPRTAVWAPFDAWLVFVMWAVMMVAMMVPSASPVVIAFATLQRRQNTSARVWTTVGAFLSGYLLVWTAFSGLATLAQWGLQRAALLTPTGASATPWLAGVFMVAAGAFQWTELKTSCLRHCRSPFAFFLASLRDGVGGAIRMGIEHGVVCVGCCWALMLLMFVAGVMNVYWLAGLALFVLVEKVAPGGERFGRWAGLGLIGWGVMLLSEAV